MGGIDGEVEEFGFVGDGLTPGAKSDWDRAGLDVLDGEEHLEVGIVAYRPLGGFRGRLLDTGDGWVIAGASGADLEAWDGLGQVLL